MATQINASLIIFLNVDGADISIDFETNIVNFAIVCNAGQAF